MVVHEDPCVDKAVTFVDVLAESIKELELVLIVFEDGRAIDPSDHDVVQGTGNV